MQLNSFLVVVEEIGLGGVDFPTTALWRFPPYSDTGVIRNTNRAGFVWEVYPDLTPPRVHSTLSTFPVSLEVVQRSHHLAGGIVVLSCLRGSRGAVDCVAQVRGPPILS